MDIVWTALGICVVVGFVFYVLAQYWQRLLASHSWSIRKLSDRLEALQEIEDPDFRRKIGDSAPSPLEQVFTFGLRLSDRFWKEALAASPAELDYVKTHGKFLGSVKIERWRSHSVATVTEILPQSKSANWQTRSLDIYSAGATGAGEAVTLWEMPLAACGQPATEPAPRVELRLRENSLELCARHGRFSPPPENGGGPQEIVFFSLPLDPARLGQFYETPEAEGPEEPAAVAQSKDSWLSYFAHEDDQLGLDWQLCVRDLGKKEAWERWKILEPVEMRRVAGGS